MQLAKCHDFIILFYGTDAWALGKAIQNKLHVFEMEDAVGWIDEEKWTNRRSNAYNKK